MPLADTTLNPVVLQTTQRIITRSRDSRAGYLAQVAAAAHDGPARGALSCTNIAHAVAASPASDKLVLHAEQQPNIAIVSSYNDMLSAHQPFERYPDLIREAARKDGATAQFAGATPAMCDGVTQGQPGMELSLFSRDTIAMSTAIALAHNVFDAALYLGVCDKIIPGLLMGALSFGHLPAVFIPAGPMTTGLPNKDKARTRQRFAAGKATREELLHSESASYHGPGTCTFYGTANSNQMLMEIMGLHVPGAAFINPGTELRDALTRAATRQVLALTRREYNLPLAHIVDEKAICNAIVGLLATGGSTNHTIHLIAIARSAGICVDWDDFSSLANVVPLLTHVYPSGEADINQFHAAGGMSVVIRELLAAGLVHEDVRTVAGHGGLRHYTQEPWLDEGTLRWREGPEQSLDKDIIASCSAPFSAHGALQVLTGNLGRAVVKSSAVRPQHLIIEAPARVFHSQRALQDAFERDELERDFVAVIMFQGPRANGMPELHKLTPILGVLLDRGYNVALVTDGRMSGASGKVPAAIHVSPECSLGGSLAKVRDGDIIRLDCVSGTLSARVDDVEWRQRTPAEADLDGNQSGMGRELFSNFRAQVSSAETGAISLYPV